jgi:GNAT superfamily N-acetyltransferase
MMILRPHLQYDARETSASFMRRLALFHTGLGAGRLVEDLRIERHAFAAGHFDATSLLAAASAIGVDHLLDGTIARFSRHREFRGERWSRGFVLPEGARFCPACLLDDGADTLEWHGKGRIVWRLRPILTCQHHCRGLVTIPEREARDELDHRYPIGMELRELAAGQVEQTPTALEDLIHSRIAGHETHEGEWLGTQTIEQVAEVCEMIGATVEQGPVFDVTSMTVEAWRRAGATGLCIASKGEPAIRDALNGIAALSETSSGKAGPRAIYGRLYEWLAYTTPVVDHGPIRALLREQILDTLAIGQDEVLLGERVDGRRLRSVHSLSEQTGLHRKRLRKILVQAGLVSEESWDHAAHRLVFPARIAEGFCRDLVDAVSLHQLAETLDCTRNQAESLYRVGILKPVIDRDLGHGIHKLAFAQREIRDFLAFLATLRAATLETPETASLTIATKRTCRTTGDLLGRIKTGDLTACRQPGRVGLANLRVIAADLQPLKILVGAAVSG